jgi:vacuolar-type H+-ATPase subunit E/Vma4
MAEQVARPLTPKGEEPATSGDGQRSAADELAAYIDAHCERQCHEVMSRAEQEARSLLVTARIAVNDRVRRAIEAERRQLQQRIHDIKSRTKASVRRASQQAMQDRLQDALPALQVRLRELWQDKEVQNAWVAAVLDLAQSCLPDQPWRIAHPETLDPACLKGLKSTEATCQTDGGIEAGLIIECQGARVDASVSGLTRRRDLVCGLLLGEVVDPLVSGSDPEDGDG